MTDAAKPSKKAEKIPTWEGALDDARDYVLDSPMYRKHTTFLEEMMTDMDKDPKLGGEIAFQAIIQHDQRCRGCGVAIVDPNEPREGRP